MEAQWGLPEWERCLLVRTSLQRRDLLEIPRPPTPDPFLHAPDWAKTLN